MRIETIPLKKLVPNQNNPRTIKDYRFKQLVQSIKDFPEMIEAREIVVNEDYLILGGNMRYRAMKEAGIKDVPVKVVDWPEEKQREFIIKDNVSEGEWDWDTLANEWDSDQLTTWGVDNPFSYEFEIFQQYERVKIADLKPHPQNYKEHPDDQLEHIMRSIKEHGLVRNVVVSKDDYILIGHGVVKALAKMGFAEMPIVRFNENHDSVPAMKLLVADNEIQHLSEVNERQLSELLKGINDGDSLEGTGYDEMMLANLVMTSRHEGEIQDFNAAAEWVGMPDFEPVDENAFKLIVKFENEEDRNAFTEEKDIKVGRKYTSGGNQKTWTTTWPFKEQDDLQSVAFDEGDNNEA